MHIIGFLILCLIWGTTWIAIKFSLEGFPPFIGAAVRFTLAVLIVGATLLLQKKSFRLSKPHLRILLIASFLMYVFDYGLIYWGELTLSPGVTAIFFATFAMFTALWSIIFLKNERLTPVRWAGLIMGLSGIIIIFYDQLVITHFDHIVTLAILGVILGAAGGALSNVLVKRHLEKVDAGVITFYQMGFGILFLYTLGFTLEDVRSIHLSPKVIASVAYLSVAGSAFAFILYYRLLKTMNTITLSLIIYVTPIIALIVDYLVYGEIIPLRSILGTLFIFGGIGLVQKKPNGKKKKE